MSAIVKGWPPLDQGQAAADRRQHAQGQHVDLEQAEGFEVVLVPLDDGALGHRGVFDGHQLGQRPAGDDEAAHVLGQVAGKADQLVGELEEHPHPRAVRVEAGFAHPLGGHLEPSHQASRRESWSSWPGSKPSARPTSRSALRGGSGSRWRPGRPGRGRTWRRCTG
jgi:hypothetical protein